MPVIGPILPRDDQPVVDARGYLTRPWRLYFQQLQGSVVFGPPVAVEGHPAVFDGTSGKRVKDGGP